MYKYIDRTDAGLNLAKYMESEVISGQYIICAIPNGGIPIAISLARELGAGRIYVYLSRKIQFPWTTEAGFGAITIDDDVFYNDAYIHSYRLSQLDIQAQTKKARDEIKTREKLFASYLLPQNLEKRKLVLIDDGLASGITMKTTLISIKKRNSGGIIIAVPTAHKQTVLEFENIVAPSLGIPLKVLSPDIREGYSFAVADAYKFWKDEITKDAIRMLDSYNIQFFGNETISA